MYFLKEDFHLDIKITVFNLKSYFDLHMKFNMSVNKKVWIIVKVYQNSHGKEYDECEMVDEITHMAVLKAKGMCTTTKFVHGQVHFEILWGRG